MSGTRTYNSPRPANAPAPAAAARPSNNAPQRDDNAPKTQAVFTLKVKGENGEMERVTGLFENTSKDGKIYYSGKSRDGVQFYLFEALPPKQ